MARGPPPGAVAEHDYHGSPRRFALEGTPPMGPGSRSRSGREGAPQHLTIVSDDHRLRQGRPCRRCPCLRCLEDAEGVGRGKSLPPPPVPDVPLKPDTLSPEEAQHWLEAFREADDDS